MKIINTEKIELFYDNCEENINNNLINDYIGLIVTPDIEAEVQQELADINTPEFSGDPKDWPSLYISADEYLKTPYNAHIKLENISDSVFSYTLEEIAAFALINVSIIQDDPNRELNDSLMLRAFDKPHTCAVLKQNDLFWMSDTFAETNTIDPYLVKCKGKTLTFGLGIGYFVFMALLNDDVESVTVIEHSPEVIKMFKTHLLPQFKNNHKINIIQGDGFDYFNKDFIDQFDYTFADIWMSNDDGLEMMTKMLEQYNPEYDIIDFWIENTCTQIVRCLMLRYFVSITYNHLLEFNNDLHTKLFNKISKYFSEIDIEVEDENILKNYLYDQKVMRAILSINV